VILAGAATVPVEKVVPAVGVCCSVFTSTLLFAA
jgi:hypothetical protein